MNIPRARDLLLFDVLPEILRARLSRVEITRRIRRDTFGHAGRVVFGAEGRDKSCDLAVSGASDANSRPDTGVVFRVRLGIRYVNDVVAIDEDPAMAIGDEDVAARRGDNVARPIKRVGPVAGNSTLAERHQHFSIRAEFEYLVAFAVLAGGVARPDVAVAVHVEAVWLIEHPLPKHL